ncbi:hypothetical protein VPH35_055608 [Triticum aestivum]
MPNLASFFLSLIRQDGRHCRFAARRHHGVGGRRHHAAGRGLRAPGRGHRAAARGDHVVAGPARAGDGIPEPALAAPLHIPPPPPAPADESGFFVFVSFPNGAIVMTQGVGPTLVAPPADEDTGPSRVVAEPLRADDAVSDEALPSPRTATRPRVLDSASMEGRCRLFGRAIAAIDRRPGRHSGLASDLPNGVPVGVVYISPRPRKKGVRRRALHDQQQ